MQQLLRTVEKSKKASWARALKLSSFKLHETDKIAVLGKLTHIEILREIFSQKQKKIFKLLQLIEIVPKFE